MSKFLSGALLALLALTLVPPSASAQRDGAPTLSTIMSEREQMETGIASLNAAQRAELEAWLARYTATVTTVARNGRPTPPAAEPRTGEATELPPLRRAEGPRRALRPPRTVPDAARVLRLMDGGDFVMLDDGTMWEVYLPDRATTVNWASGDAVRVRQRPAPIGVYDYDLHYGPRRERVAARFAGWVEMQRGPRRQYQ